MASASQSELNRPFFSIGATGPASPDVIGNLLREVATRLASIGPVEVCDITLSVATRHQDQNVVTVYFHRDERRRHDRDGS